MTEAKIYFSDETDKRLREKAMKKFGYGRGSISNAVEEAVSQWLSKEAIIESKLNLMIEKAKKDKNIIAILLFGSYARRDKNYRDVDVALVLKDNAKYEEELFDYFKAINSVENKVIDIVIFNTLPLEIKRKVMNDAEILYSANNSELYDKSIDTIKKWNEYSYMFNSMI
ncbi:MAG: nucleotidyltransferase domain-containing protein [Candidatus Micrarchaeaceae archaeon]|jgi:predicted nucleotidyltransferase